MYFFPPHQTPFQGCQWRRGHHEVWSRVSGEGKLTCRTVLGLLFDPSLEGDRRQVRELRALYSNNPKSMLR